MWWVNVKSGEWGYQIKMFADQYVAFQLTVHAVEHSTKIKYYHEALFFTASQFSKVVYSP